MSKFVLNTKEEILAVDTILFYTNNLLAHHANCTLTNQRLYIEPQGFLDKLSFPEIEIFIKDITKLDFSQNLHHIYCNEQVFKMANSGAERICQRLEKMLQKDPEILQEKVLLQGDTNVYIKGPLSTKGEIILSNKTLTVKSTNGLESKLFSPKKLETPLLDIQHLEYSNLEQKLKILSKHGEIVVGGQVAAKLHATLKSLEGAYVDDLQDVNVQSLSTYEALLYRGASKPAITGDISLAINRFVFTPGNVLDTLTGVQLQILPYQDIQKLSITNNLELATTKTQLQFITSQKELLMQLLYEKCRAIIKPPIFEDIRSKRYSEKENRSALAALKLPFDISNEVPLLCEQSILYRNEDQTIYFTLLLMTDKTLRLLALNNKVLWQCPNTAIQIVENRNPKETKLSILVRGKKIVIDPYSGVKFHDYFKRKVIESRPTEAEQFTKTNQSVKSILGQCLLVQFFDNGQKIHQIENTNVLVRARGIQISGPKSSDFPCAQGSKIQVEIPKKTGRFLFETIITEQYISEPDPMGRHYITLAEPKDISLSNERRDYRAPITMDLDFSIFELPDYDIEHDDVETQIPFATPVSEMQVVLEDLSISGCAIVSQNSLNTLNLPLHRLLLKSKINLFDEDIPCMCIPKYEVQHPHPDKEGNRIGLEFVKMNNLDRSLINRMVLQIEREQIRKENDQKQDEF